MPYVLIKNTVTGELSLCHEKELERWVAEHWEPMMKGQKNIVGEREDIEKHIREHLLKQREEKTSE